MLRTESFSNSRLSVALRSTPPHLFPHDDLIRLVIFKGQWIDALWPFELNLGDRREEFASGFLGAGFSHDGRTLALNSLASKLQRRNHAITMKSQEITACTVNPENQKS